MKRLIVNADDFGYSKGINEGIIKAYKEAVITSTSLMVHGAAAKEAGELAKKNPELGIGLHFQVENYDWNLLWQLKKIMSAALIEGTKKEFLKQIELFKKLVGKTPDHIDGHHHVHKMPRIYQFVSSWCKENNTPFRGQVNFIDKFFGEPVETMTIDNLVKILRNLSDGTSELMCHPGFVTSDLRSSYSSQRELELKILTSPKIKAEIKNQKIKLISWKEI